MAQFRLIKGRISIKAFIHLKQIVLESKSMYVLAIVVGIVHGFDNL